jgi:hypothetical protein
MAITNTQPYIPSFLKAALLDTRPVQLTFEDLAGTNSNITSTSSFKYEPLNYPLKNTQQLNVDWSKFENHTFFQSAEVKTNVAFDQIINGYPFDGTKKEVEAFFEKISGFEKYVFDQFPTFGGQLHFSGTQVSETLPTQGTYITTKDIAGWLFPSLAKNKSGESVFNPVADKSFTVELHAFIPDQTNSRQVIIQKQSANKDEGFTFHLEPSSTSEVKGVFSFVSGGVNNHVEATLTKGQFNHLCMTLNKESGPDYLQFFINEELVATSQYQKEFGDFSERTDMYIGSGSSFFVTGTLISPQQTFSGSLDELRIFHSTRSIKQQELYRSKGIYATDNLKLYYRFNEPSSSYASSPSDTVNSIVLDSSGNSLHGTINNYNSYGSSSLRQPTSIDSNSLMTNERGEFKKILFPLDPSVVALNESLLTTASLYDLDNPNLITKLIPRHYLREGAQFEGIPQASLEGTITDSYSGQGIPGQGKLGSVQVMLSFLYIWAKFFDEIKMFADAFKTLRTVGYDLNETIPDSFLNDFIKDYGFYLPPLFNSANIQQYVEGEDVSEIGINDYTIKQVQSHLLRRVLINMPDIIRSKGTQHSIRSFLRSLGIDPNNSLRIREYGGPSLKQFETTREYKVEQGILTKVSGAVLLTSNYLSASRVEPGYPEIIGTFVNGVSSNPSDGLLTSGSWTYEGIYKFSNNSAFGVQSLARLHTTGSSPYAQSALLLNLVYSGGLHLYARPGLSTTSPLLQLSLTGFDIFDGNKWNVSFGCQRSDQIGSVISSSYFLRASTQSGGDITEYYTTSSFFDEATPIAGIRTSYFKNISSVYNASGSWVEIGDNQNIPEGAMGYLFLNNTIDVPASARITDFDGRVGYVRFWSKALTESEWRDHVRNYKSQGVSTPLTNFNYVTNKSGSFEKLRMSVLEKQSTKISDSFGKIVFLDYSENGIHMTGSGYTALVTASFGETFDRNYLSPYYDEYSTSEKIRIRGFLDEKNMVDAPWAIFGPAKDYPANEKPLDDTRLSIEFSLIDSLNKDIINMFAMFDELATAIGDPTLAYSPDYPDLEKLRNIYFNRLSEKLNFRSFFEFYKWFDTSISTFIEQLVPRKTRFKGTNFVIESHMLERHKIEYQSSEIYLGDSTRSRIRDTLLVQQITGKIGRF